MKNCICLFCWYCKSISWRQFHVFSQRRSRRENNRHVTAGFLPPRRVGCYGTGAVLLPFLLFCLFSRPSGSLTHPVPRQSASARINSSCRTRSRNKPSPAKRSYFSKILAEMFPPNRLLFSTGTLSSFLQFPSVS